MGEGKRKMCGGWGEEEDVCWVRNVRERGTRHARALKSEIKIPLEEYPYKHKYT